MKKTPQQQLDDELAQRLAELRQQEGTEDTSRSIRLKIGDAFNARIHMKQAIGAVSISTLVAIGGMLMAAGKFEGTKKTPVDARLDGLDQKVPSLETRVTSLESSVDRLWCAMMDQWRWEAVRSGETERAHYLTRRLDEMARSGKECR